MPDTLTPGGTYRLAGRDVARIGYGVMQLAESPGRGAIAPSDATALLRHALDIGITHFDTAEFYGDGTANRMLQGAFHPYRDDIVIASKVGAFHVPDAQPSLVPGQKPDELRRQVEMNLATLGTDRIDVVNLRRVDGGAGIVATGDQVVSLDDQLAALITLRDEGKIGGIGLSNVDADTITRALPAGIVCVQNMYNLTERSSEAALAVCAANGIAWVPFFPLGSGFAGFTKVTDVPAVQDAATRLNATPAQVGLAWLLANSPNTLLIPGTTSIAHLDENAAAGDLALDVDTMAVLDAV